MTFGGPVSHTPAGFYRAQQDLLQAKWRAEMTCREIPVPQRIAPYSAAVAADLHVSGKEIGAGRFILLHDPQENTVWDGTFRCVTYAKSEVTPDMGTDELLTDVGWSWLIDALESRGAQYLAEAGTVTTVGSKAFGDISDKEPRFEIEIRASWTPLLKPDGDGLLPHLEAWEELLCQTAGLAPLPAGVTALEPRLR